MVTRSTLGTEIPLTQAPAGKDARIFFLEKELSALRDGPMSAWGEEPSRRSSKEPLRSKSRHIDHGIEVQPGEGGAQGFGGQALVVVSVVRRRFWEY